MGLSESLCLLLVRHGKAGESNPRRFPDDDLRPLTGPGRKEFGQAARALRGLGLRPAIVLTSPVLRAHETAEILRREAAFRSAPLVPLPQLRYDADPQTALEALRLQARHALPGREKLGRALRLVGLVGHEPWMGEFLSRLLFGRASAALPFKKGGCALVQLDEIAFGAARLLAFHPPDALRQLES